MEKVSPHYTELEKETQICDHETGESISHSASERQRFRYRSSPLSANLSFGGRLLNVKDNIWNRTQLSPSEIEKSVWSVVKSPYSCITGSIIPLSICIKYLYADQLPSFAAIRLVGLEIDLVSRPKTANTKHQKIGAAGKRKSEPSEEDILSLTSFSASGHDNPPTLALDNELDLSSIANLRMPRLHHSLTAGTGTSHFLQIYARFEYFDCTYTAKWLDIPFQIEPEPTKGKKELKSQTPSSTLGDRPPSFKSVDSLDKTVLSEKESKELGRAPTLPVYEAEACVPIGQPVPVESASQFVFFAREDSPHHGIGPTSARSAEPPAFDALPGQAL